MLIILPDPTTRRCPRHRDELMTDSIPCIRCEGERLADEFLASLEANVKAAFARVAETVATAVADSEQPRSGSRSRSRSRRAKVAA